MHAFFQNSMRLFGPFHLAWLIFGIPLAVGAAAVLARVCLVGAAAPWVRCQRAVRCFWLVFLLLELWKQLTLEQYAGAGERYWFLPFQLCSMPLYLCLPAAAARRPGCKQALCCFLSGYSLLGGLLTLAFPQDILIRPLPLALHGFLWHILLIVLGCFLIFTGYGRAQSPRWTVDKRHAALWRVCRGVIGESMVLLCCAAVAWGLNMTLWEPSGHTINLFYLGPMPNTQPVFCRLYACCGWGVTLLCYLCALLVGGAVFSLPYLVPRSAERQSDKVPIRF